MFRDPEYAETAAYKRFWERLAVAEFEQAGYKCRAKDGGDMWILASNNPILDASGKPCKVIKFATDITAEKTKNAELTGKAGAISE